MTNSDLIKKFYESFVSGDAKSMLSCYADNIVFSDPAFGELKGEQAKKMWRMLIERGKGDLKISFDNVKADDKTGSAGWTAVYTFSATGRKVINEISASFEFENGKITKHDDHFDLYKW